MRTCLFLLLFAIKMPVFGQFQWSTLPILSITTNGQAIPDEPKITVQIRVFDHGNGQINRLTDIPAYDLPIGIEQRGASTQGYDQKSYSFETRDNTGADFEVPLLGLPPESDWILRAPYADKSLLRDIIAYQISNEMGTWAPHTRLCEVVVDGDYRGVYILMERIKRTKNRLDLAKLTKDDLSGAELTGSYIVKVDRWELAPGWVNTSPDNFTGPRQQVYLHYVYPQAEDIQPEQQQYIQQYIDSFQVAMAAGSFENPLTGWRKYADEASFIDHFLLNEFTRNVDAYRLSGFFHKDKNGKLKAGPAWDFNFSMRNGDYCNAQYAAGWTYERCDGGVPWWWYRLLKDDAYTNQMRCRWETLRHSVLDADHLMLMVDSLHGLVLDAQQRHFNRWRIMGNYIWPNPSPLAHTHEEEIAAMKKWLTLRLHWMDAALAGNCMSFSDPIPLETRQWMLSPNPTRDHLSVFAFKRPVAGTTLDIMDMTGRLVYRTTVESDLVEIPLHGVSSGVYIALLRDIDGAIFWKERFVKE